eukprot:4769661-Ditylum_brightwellii.AAC.1
MGAIKHHSIGIGTAADRNSLHSVCFHLSTGPAAITKVKKVSRGDKVEKDTKIRFGAMDHFKQSSKFTIKCDKHVIADLRCMAEGPPPEVLQHTHISDVGMAHMADCLPRPFNKAVLMLTATGSSCHINVFFP